MKTIDVHFNNVGGETCPNYKAELNKLLDWWQHDGAFPSQDDLDSIINMANRAGHWHFCSVGSICKAIPRTNTSKGDYSPVDGKLFRNGMDFMYAMKALQFAAIAVRQPNDYDPTQDYIIKPVRLIIYDELKSLGSFTDENGSIENEVNKDYNPELHRLIISAGDYQMPLLIRLVKMALSEHINVEQRAGEILDEMFPDEESWSAYVQQYNTTKS